MTGHWVEDETPPTILLDQRVPIVWDGYPVRWVGWNRFDMRFLCANNRLLQTELCAQCRHPWLPWVNKGLTVPDVFSLKLERCPWCGLTLAESKRFDENSWTSWVLDDSDYGPEGSVADRNDAVS